MYRKTLTLVFSFFLSPILIAQKEGKLLLFVNAEDAYVKIDSNAAFKMTATTLLLPITEGVHKVQVWATTRQLFDKTIQIKADSTTRLTVNLPTAAAYKAFRETTSQNALGQSMTIAGKVFLVAANVGLTWFVTLQGRSTPEKYNTEAKTYLTQYNFATTEIYARIYREDFTEAKGNYQKAIKYYNTKLIIGVPVALCSYYLTYRVFKQINKNKPEIPVYKDKNPLTQWQAEITPTYDWATIDPSYNLSFKLKF